MQPDPQLVAAIAAKLLEQVRPAASPAIGALWDGFWNAVGKHKRSKRDIRGTWMRLNRYQFADGRTVATLPAAELGVSFPALYRDWRTSTTTRRGKAPAVGTINRELERLRAVLNWAVEAGLLSHHPLCSIHMEREDSVKQTKIRSEEDFEALLRACAERHYALPTLCLLYYDGGLRRLEGFQTRWADIEAKADGGGLLRLAGRRTKSGKHRLVHLTRRTMVQLGALPRASEWVFANTRIYPNGRKQRYYGQPYNPMYLYRLFQAAVGDSGLEAEEGETITFHTLRHSFAYRARRRWRWPEQVIMRQGGWSTRSAFDRYGISDDEELAEAMVSAEAAIREDSRKPPRPTPLSGDHVSKSIRKVTK